MFPLAYRLVTRFAQKIPLPSGRLASSLAGQRTAEARWIEWASINRTQRPLVWVHGASVGENLSAVPVISRLRTTTPGLQVVHSYTSPSAKLWRDTLGCDRADFLPPDMPDSMASVLSAVRPDLLVFSRGDLWPVMIQTTAALGVPIALVGGTVSPSSRRLWAPIRRALRPTYERVRWIGTVSQGDAGRLISLGANADAVVVTGDPRNDQVIERNCDLSVISPLLQWSGVSPTLVAGSTDLQDERVLLRALSLIAHNKKAPDTRLILVPHDVSDRRIRQVLETGRRHDVFVDVFNGQPPRQEAPCVVVQKMGVLADLYALAEFAYVGGGFKRGGLHAVIEPAAFAVPVIAGPEHEDSQAFRMLLGADGAVGLPRRGAAERLCRTWIDWVSHPERRFERGLRARRTLQQGAATASAVALLRLISGAVQ